MDAYWPELVRIFPFYLYCENSDSRNYVLYISISPYRDLCALPMEERGSYIEGKSETLGNNK